MRSDLELLRDIQSIDTRAGELERELSALPLHIAEIEKKLEAHRESVEAQKEALAANAKERRRLEGEAELHQQRVARLQDQLLEAKTNEQYRAFRNEIAFAQKEVRKAEDLILDKEEEAEALQARLVEAEKDLEQQAEAIAAEVEETKGRFKGDQDELERVRQKRQEAAERADRRLLAVYDRIRSKLGGAAVSAMVEGRCSSCNMLIRPQLAQDIRAGERVVHCEFCDCILYYDDPAAVSTEDPAGEAGIR